MLFSPLRMNWLKTENCICGRTCQWLSTASTQLKNYTRSVIAFEGFKLFLKILKATWGLNFGPSEIVVPTYFQLESSCDPKHERDHGRSLEFKNFVPPEWKTLLSTHSKQGQHCGQTSLLKAFWRKHINTEPEILNQTGLLRCHKMFQLHLEAWKLISNSSSVTKGKTTHQRNCWNKFYKPSCFH